MYGASLSADSWASVARNNVYSELVYDHLIIYHLPDHPERKWLSLMQAATQRHVFDSASFKYACLLMGTLNSLS